MSDSSSQVEPAQPIPSVDEYHIPTEYKIVDLPIIEIPQMQVLKTYNCKIYRRVELGEISDPATNANYEWKRKCYGRVKFVLIDDQVVVAAYQFGGCHLRFKEKPLLSEFFYKLQPSIQYENNWQFKTEEDITYSISLSAADYQQFFTSWESAKIKNTEYTQKIKQSSQAAPEQPCPNSEVQKTSQTNPNPSQKSSQTPKNAKND